MKTPITPKGKQALESELKHLIQKERPTVIKEIEEARANGDLSENADYDAAKEKQGFIESRISEIESKLASSEVIDTSSIKSDHIVFGAHVKVKNLETEDTLEYQILGETEADIKEGKISILSPLARALIGKTKGDIVELVSPKGQTEYEVLDFYFSIVMEQETYLKSWILFIVSIVLAVFLGGAVKASFSKAFLQQKVADYWKEKGFFFDLSVEDSGLILSDGFWPQFVIELKKVKLISPGKCPQIQTISADRLRLSLFRNIVTADNFNILPADCALPLSKAYRNEKSLKTISYILEQQGRWILRSFSELFDVFHVNTWALGDLAKGEKLTLTPLSKKGVLKFEGDGIFYENIWQMEGF